MQRLSKDLRKHVIHLKTCSKLHKTTLQSKKRVTSGPIKMHITRMSVAIPMRVPLKKYQTIYFIMNSSASPHWLHQLLTRDVDQIHKISSKLRANSHTKVCSLMLHFQKEKADSVMITASTLQA